MAAVTEVNIDPDAKKLTVDAGMRYVDNYHPQLQEGISAYGISTTLSGKLVTLGDALWGQVSYSWQHNQFKPDATVLSLDDKFNNYQVDFVGRLFVSHSWYFDVNVSHDHVDEFLDEGIARFQSATNLANSYALNQASGVAVYGRETSQNSIARLVKFGIYYSSKSFEDSNVYSTQFDVARSRVSAELYYGVSELTSIETVVEFEQFDYVDETNVDNDLYRVLVGLEWKSSGKTKLEVLLGGYQRVYVSGPKQQGFLAEIEGEYVPSEDFAVRLGIFQRSVADVTAVATNTISKSASLDLDYQLREHIGWNINLLVSQTEYELVDDMRQTDETSFGSSLQISMFDYSAINLKLSRESLTDDSIYLNYTQNKVELNWHHEF